MKKIYAILIVILIIIVVILVYGWLSGNWFARQEQPQEKVVEEKEEIILDDEEQAEFDRLSEEDANLMTQAQDAQVALQVWGLERGSLPPDLADLVPDFLAEVPKDVTYVRLSDYSARVEVSLSDQSADVMMDDEGKNDELFELEVEMPST